MKYRLWRWGARGLSALDWPLLLIVCAFAGLGMLVMHSAVGGTDGRFIGQLRNFALAFMVMWGVALVPLRRLMQWAPTLYTIGCALLMAVLLVGYTSKGATRWLDIGFTRIQPSEVMKIFVPLMLAWYFDKHRKHIAVRDFLVAGVLLALPFALIIKQPDLGTALLVLASGFFVIYFAGLSFALLVPVVLLGLSIIVGVLYFEPVLCAPDFDWRILHAYQKTRVCTLLDPTSDPLGKGFHTLQGMIAIGSGGWYGKGYLQGTQTHLDFIPEQTTDFIFAVFAEEFGLYGSVALLFLYALLLLRGFWISYQARTQFGMLLAAAMTMMIFFYVFVNMGMVMGILPIVGVPLPFMSYGGTALLTMGVACGLLMNVANHVPTKR